MARGPLVLDAAMGTRLIARGLDLAGDDPALWNLSHPEVVAELHRRDVAAGLRRGPDEHLRRQSTLARPVRPGRARSRRSTVAPWNSPGRRRAPAGSSSDRSGRPRPKIPGAYSRAGRGPGRRRRRCPPLRDPLASTRPSGRSSRSAAPSPLPLLVCLLDWPRSPAEPARRLADLGAAALGANCQLGMEPALRLAEALHRVTDLPLIVKPGAGLPGEPPASPESFARAVSELEALGVRLIGGCCGTTEAHVAALRSACPPWNSVRHSAASSPNTV